MTGMTDRQRRLARHALGLPNARGRSYRNRFVCASGDCDHAQWIRMAELGLADHGPVFHPYDRSHAMQRFWLTPKGAMAALEPGETLDPEDFPT